MRPLNCASREAACQLGGLKVKSENNALSDDLRQVSSDSGESGEGIGTYLGLDANLHDIDLGDTGRQLPGLKRLITLNTRTLSRGSKSRMSMMVLIVCACTTCA